MYICICSCVGESLSYKTVICVNTSRWSRGDEQYKRYVNVKGE